MSKLKRLPVKYIRDKAKSAYKKGDHCYICGTTEKLELHHFAGLTDLWERWTRKNKINIDSVEDILEHREGFIADHHEELYEDVVTLCKEHHAKLHSIFGKAPQIYTAKTQARWADKQRSKRGNTSVKHLD